MLRLKLRDWPPNKILEKMKFKDEVMSKLKTDVFNVVFQTLVDTLEPDALDRVVMLGVDLHVQMDVIRSDLVLEVKLGDRIEPSKDGRNSPDATNSDIQSTRAINEGEGGKRGDSDSTPGET